MSITSTCTSTRPFQYRRRVAGASTSTSTPFSVRRPTWFSLSSTRTNSAATTSGSLAIR